jgi:hypothetical protein
MLASGTGLSWRSKFEISKRDYSRSANGALDRAKNRPVLLPIVDVDKSAEKGERFSKLRTAFDSAFVESAWNASLHECRTILAQKGRSLFRVFSSRYRAQVALLNSCLNVPLPKTAEQRLLLVDGLIAAQVEQWSCDYCA